MNRLFYLFLCAFLFACTQTEKKDSGLEEGRQQADTAEYALPLDSAVLYINRYDSIAQAILKNPAPVRAYTVRAADLLEALGLPENIKTKYKHVRAYVGMDLNNQFRLFFTPVEGASIHETNPGKDIILKGAFTRGLRGDTGIDATVIQNGEYVLDFTAPCPNTCPSDSPLSNQ